MRAPTRDRNSEVRLSSWEKEKGDRGGGSEREQDGEREKAESRGEERKEGRDVWVRERTGLSIQTWPVPPHVPTPLR